jgi:putative hemolysin
MNNIVMEIVVVFILTVLNGFFSMSEMALVTVRKTRIAFLAKQGSKRAKVVKLLQQNPETFFATIQIGISIITIAASAFAGASLAEELSGLLIKANFSLIAENAQAISFGLVVALVSYANITIGELIPKSLGLRFSEPIALLAAYPIWWLSRASGWQIRILNFTSNLFLKIFKDSTTFTESRLSEEEIRSLLAEGRKAGTIEAAEHNIIENVFEFSDLSVGKIMVPRANMVALDADKPVREIIQTAIDSGFSRAPVYKGNFNHVIGILYTKRLLAKFGSKESVSDVNEFLVAPYFVPNAMKISEVLQRLQRKKSHMALVTDEHGEIEGLVTLEDILEEIVGDITDETDEINLSVSKREDGAFLVDGGMSIVDFNRYFKTDLPENLGFITLSGYVLDRLGRFPDVGDTVKHKSFELKVNEITLRTVKTLLVIVEPETNNQ